MIRNFVVFICIIFLGSNIASAAPWCCAKMLDSQSIQVKIDGEKSSEMPCHEKTETSKKAPENCKDCSCKYFFSASNLNFSNIGEEDYSGGKETPFNDDMVTNLLSYLIYIPPKHIS